MSEEPGGDESILATFAFAHMDASSGAIDMMHFNPARFPDAQSRVIDQPQDRAEAVGSDFGSRTRKVRHKDQLFPAARR